MLTILKPQHPRVNLINASPDGSAARLYVDDVLCTQNGVNFGL
ncbi:hypothetical protein [Mucilaginibacter terrae]|uniref:Uncharacterized protein n=1 Tax=Mucilaginibacter terrae TaxID=1955052 RepID=A0ABU3GTH0_9SPHI|nr:hypothetical protein [Mucilaginibacter terrae]MDT3403079.1 hypothetical protein [Mucilaginibacter terrae]